MSPFVQRPALARRLRALRESQWPDVGITQAQLAEALGGGRALSVSLISSWENAEKPVTPPVRRLDAYARLFATRRSVDGETIRILPLEQLTEEEQNRRTELLEELLHLRDGRDWIAHSPAEVWSFPEDEDVTIVCARIPVELRQDVRYEVPGGDEFVSLYTYADVDALIELFGHIRSVNPRHQISFRGTEELTPDDYTTHLVLLGHVDWETGTRELLERVDLSARQVARDGDAGKGGFRVEVGGRCKVFAPRIDVEGRLLEDVAHFYRGVSPFNRKRTLTVCNGMYSCGTLGAVRALTDVRFRDRNRDYLQSRFGNAEYFSIVSRVPVIAGRGLTPDWTMPENRLYEWPEVAE